MELNRNPDNYFAEIEQVAFAPSNVVPGIGFSPDKMLQARTFSYAEAHRYRLGTHYEALPVNRPRCPVAHYHKDGPMRFFRNDTGNPDAYYEPNSMGVPAEDPAYAEPPLRISGAASRYDRRAGNDDYAQAGNLYRLFTAEQKERLHQNIAEAMAGVPEAIVQRQLAHFSQADPAYEAGVAKALGAMQKHAAKASPMPGGRTRVAGQADLASRQTPGRAWHTGVARTCPAKQRRILRAVRVSA